MDYQAILFDPIYLVQGVPAVLNLADDSESAEGVALTVLDKTAGIGVGEDVQVQTVKPAAIVRVAELTAKSVTVDSLEGARIAFNDLTWTVESFRLKPSPKGERDGEVFLILTDKEAASESESESES